MRIIYFAHSVLSRGGDKMALAHLGHLAEKGHEVIIRTGRLETVFPLHERVRVERMRGGGVAGTLLRALLEKRDGTVYIAGIIILAFLLAVRNRGRVLFFAQGYDEYNCANPFGRHLIRAVLQVSLKAMQLPVVAVSEHLGRFLQGKYDADVLVVKNGVDPVFFSTKAEDMDAFLTPGKKVILLHTRTDFAKGLDSAVAAIRHVKDEIDASLEVWTVGAHTPETLNGIPHRDFGYVSAEKLGCLMSAATLFVHPSRHEGFGLMVLEAFARRCPVVTTTAVYFAEHEINALVSAVDDIPVMAKNIQRLLEDDTLGGALSANGYEVACASRLESSLLGFESALLKRFSAADRVNAASSSTEVHQEGTLRQ